jgi:hypothetical protein
LLEEVARAREAVTHITVVLAAETSV